jgi:hypothetical protein
MASAAASNDAPLNLGLGLRELVQISQANPAEVQQQIASAPSITTDTAGRVVANVKLNGAVSVPEMQPKLVALGLEIVAVDEHWRSGVISVWLPLNQAIAAAKLDGVRSISLARKPIRHVGSVTAESSVTERAADVNMAGVITPQGIIGRGISIGIVSDSYDKAPNVPRASAGVTSGDLPGPGNPDGYSQPVVVLQDDASVDVTDEGRAMAEIVHDIAPAAKIAYSASGPTQASMATSIRNLRTSSQTLCDIIVDDIGYVDEPFFSDGMIAQAIDDVVTSNTLPGKKVAFFSAAGNSDNHGYAADANIIPSAMGPQSAGNVKLNQVPSSLYAGGFQNLNTSGPPSIVMSVTTDADPAGLVLQWDDPFNTGGVTTDYNLLVFNSAGTYLSSISGKDNNFATSEPVEIINLGANTTYQVVISLASAAPPVAKHLRMLSFGDGSVTGPYLSNNVIGLTGHPTAANANAVAAYVYNNTPNTVTDYNPNHLNPPPGPYEPAFESFSARGGSVPIYFNRQGQRLSSPELRQKPEFAAADGVDTSFFPTDADADYDNNGFPNFFGTSAAAPNAAAFAALLLEIAGGPGSLNPFQIRTALQHSTYPHDLDPDHSQALVFGPSGHVSEATLSATGDDSNESATSPNFFDLSFSSPDGAVLKRLTIDLSRTSIVFDPRPDLGFPFTIGSNTGGVSVTPSLSPDLRVLTLDFGDTFASDKSISFGIDRDLAGINAGGNSADLLGGVSVAAVTSYAPSMPQFGALSNQLGNNFVPRDGEGLIDALRVAEWALGHHIPIYSGVSANLSTRGRVGAGDDVLIGGLIIDYGAAPKRIVIRAIGSSLPITGALADPILELHDAFGAIVSTNDNWQDDPAQAAEIAAAGLAPSDSHESAIIKTLDARPYTAIVRGANSSTGVGLVEVYDLDNANTGSLLQNIATRGTVESGDDVMIAGFILRQAPSQVAIRALGASLSGNFPPGSRVLADPLLELRDGQGNLLMINDNWQENPLSAALLTSAGLAPGAVESALVTTLSPGNYTAIVRGAHGTTGNAIVEVYNLR